MLTGNMEYLQPEVAPDGGVISDFFGEARSKLNEVLAPMQETQSGPTVGSQLFDAIYQYGRGKFDVAREKAVGAFLMTSEGKKAQQVGISQTVHQYLPYIIATIAGIFLLGFFAKR